MDRQWSEKQPSSSRQDALAEGERVSHEKTEIKGKGNAKAQGSRSHDLAPAEDNYLRSSRKGRLSGSLPYTPAEDEWVVKGKAKVEESDGDNEAWHSGETPPADLTDVFGGQITRRERIYEGDGAYSGC